MNDTLLPDREDARPPQAPQPPVPPRPPRRSNSLSALSLILSGAALVLSVCALWLALPERSAAPAEEGPGQSGVTSQATITYNGRELPVHPDVGLNQYDEACFAAGEDGRITYVSGETEALTGVDVSEFQGEIDWEQVKASGVDFAMIRAGFRGYGKGVIVEDACFRQNLQGALDAGLQVGVYFFSQAVNVWEAEEEAAFVLEAIQGYDVTFPIVFDWERIHNAPARTDDLSPEELTRCAGAFCDVVAQAGYIPVIYFNQDQGYLTYDLPKLKEYTFWLAEYRSAPTFHYHFDLWQYSCTGSVPGIQGNVDLDLSFVDFGALS